MNTTKINTGVNSLLALKKSCKSTTTTQQRAATTAAVIWCYYVGTFAKWNVNYKTPE